MLSNFGHLRRRLYDGATAIGFWSELCAPLATEVLAGTGFDFCVIDHEHGPGGPFEAMQIMMSLKGSACAPLIRVPENNPVPIKRALDTGAEGLVIPAVNSAEEAGAAVAACLYPPAGMRGNAVPVVRASAYGAHAADYAAQADRELLIICQIEAAQAVQNVEAIAAVERVDMLFIGPMDLSGDMGFIGQPDHPEVRRAIAHVEQVAKDNGKLLGTITTPKRSIGDLAAAGHRLIAAASDTGLLQSAAASLLANRP